MVFVRGDPVDAIRHFIGQWKIICKCNKTVTMILPMSCHPQYSLNIWWHIIISSLSTKCIYDHYIDDSTFATKVTMAILDKEYISDTLSSSYGDNCKWMKVNLTVHK